MVPIKPRRVVGWVEGEDEYFDDHRKRRMAGKKKGGNRPRW